MVSPPYVRERLTAAPGLLESGGDVEFRGITAQNLAPVVKLEACLQLVTEDDLQFIG